MLGNSTREPVQAIEQPGARTDGPSHNVGSAIFIIDSPAHLLILL